MKFTRVLGLAAFVGAVATIAVATYALLASRRVYEESWPRTLMKSAGISFLYVLSSFPPFMLIIAWAALSAS
jgi:hypothetical protein